MGLLLDVILPVFVVLGAGYFLARSGRFTDSAIDALMWFSQGLAVPCLLFRQMVHMDLSTDFGLPMLASFYAGAFLCFSLAFGLAWKMFHRPLEECVAAGFAAMFSNTLLLGLPITERAYGTGALSGNYAIIAMHSPMFYAFGITVMELVRHHGQGLSLRELGGKVGRAIGTQPLVVAIACGFVVNVSGLPLPGALDAGAEMLGKAGLPTALFGLGGVLWRYKPEGDKGVIGLIVGLALVIHPAVTFGLGHLFGLDVAAMRSAVVTAAMPPGANAYLFAHMYQTGQRSSASAVLWGTALALASVWFWLSVLP